MQVKEDESADVQGVKGVIEVRYRKMYWMDQHENFRTYSGL